MSIEPIKWKNNRLYLLDQRILPEKETYLECKTYRDAAKAITQLVVRGAPAIGVTAAMGLAVGAKTLKDRTSKQFRTQFNKMCDHMAAARPTAVNLFWAIERIKGVVAESPDAPVKELIKRLQSEAGTMLEEDIACNRRMGQYGRRFFRKGANILTHCNAGALATGGYGTALGVVRAAHEQGKGIHVFADETRPFLQGARLTAWELKKDKIPVSVITDNMAGALMQQGRVDAVIVGADRIASNGDVANKIGTYGVALLAKAHKIPFYVAAPLSTIDFAITSGDNIPIEERSTEEVTIVGTKRMVPRGVPVWHPAFDVTPNKYVSAIITDRGVAQRPYRSNLKKLKDKKP